MLEQALDDWQMGMRWRLPTRGQGWVYLTGALIHELLARVSDAPGELIHRAALQAEQAAALDGASADAWALLCRYHRILRQINVAQHAAAHALDCDRANANANFERLVTAVVTAAPEALDLLDDYEQRFVRGNDSVVLGLRGYRLLLEGDLGAACETLARSLDADASDIWVRSRMALCAALTGDDDVSQGAAQQVWEETAEGTPRTGLMHSDVRALAALLSRRFDEADDALATGMTVVWQNPVELGMGSAVASQMRGDPAGAWRHASDAVREIRHSGEASLARLYLDLLERWAPDTTTEMKQARKDITARAEELADHGWSVTGAVKELRTSSAEGKPATVPWLLAHAGLARVLAAEGHWEEAAAVDEGLLPFNDALEGVPAARQRLNFVLRRASDEAMADHDIEAVRRSSRRLADLGESTAAEEALSVAMAERAAQRSDAAFNEAERARVLAARAEDRRCVQRALVLQGDILLDLGRQSEAQTRYEDALQQVSSAAGEITDRTAIEARLAILAGQRGDIAKAFTALERVVDALLPSEGIAAAASTVRRQCAQLVEQHGESHAFSAAFRALIEDPGLRGRERRGLASARFAIRRGSYIAVAARRPDQITVQAGPQLFPEGEADEAARRLHEAIPALRENLLVTTGVRIPGVGVRPNDLLPGRRFRMLINEVPYAVGTVPTGSRLLVGCSGDETAAQVRNAWSGESATWSAGPTSNANGLDPQAGIAWLLEGLLRTNLAQFVTLAEVDYQLDVWEAGGGSERAKLLAQALPSRRSHTRMVAVIRRLVREQVPVDRLGVIVETVGQMDSSSSIGTLGDAVRSKLVDILPGADGNREQLVVPEAVEAAFRTAARPIPQGLARSIVERLEETIGDRAPGQFVLVVRDSALRSAVQNTCERIVASVAVLSETEAHGNRLDHWA